MPLSHKNNRVRAKSAQWADHKQGAVFTPWIWEQRRQAVFIDANLDLPYFNVELKRRLR